jgi:CheY-like chemotaxis protein
MQSNCVWRESLLRDAGLSVARASSADEALDCLRSLPARVKVVVTDHIMPEGNGSVFIRQLRKFCPSVPVVVISGMSEAEHEYSGLLEVTFRRPAASFEK